MAISSCMQLLVYVMPIRDNQFSFSCQLERQACDVALGHREIMMRTRLQLIICQEISTASYLLIESRFDRSLDELFFFVKVATRWSACQSNWIYDFKSLGKLGAAFNVKGLEHRIREKKTSSFPSFLLPSWRNTRSYRPYFEITELGPSFGSIVRNLIWK